MWLSVINGGDDATVMPQYFKRWEQGLPELRKQLVKVDDVAYFSKADKQLLKERMHTLGLDTNQKNAMPLTGRSSPVLVVFDPATLKVLAMVAPPHAQHFELQHWMGQQYFKNLLAHQTKVRH
jgi:hypothetical protein